MASVTSSKDEKTLPTQRSIAHVRIWRSKVNNTVTIDVIQGLRFCKNSHYLIIMTLHVVSLHTEKNLIFYQRMEIRTIVKCM